jgi:hypothetical protein
MTHETQPKCDAGGAAVSALVDGLLPPLLALLQSDDADVCASTLQQINALVRHLQKSCADGAALPPPAHDQVRVLDPTVLLSPVDNPVLSPLDNPVLLSPTVDNPVLSPVMLRFVAGNGADAYGNGMCGSCSCGGFCWQWLGGVACRTVWTLTRARTRRLRRRRRCGHPTCPLVFQLGGSNSTGAIHRVGGCRRWGVDQLDGPASSAARRNTPCIQSFPLPS